MVSSGYQPGREREATLPPLSAGTHDPADTPPAASPPLTRTGPLHTPRTQLYTCSCTVQLPLPRPPTHGRYKEQARKRRLASLNRFGLGLEHWERRGARGLTTGAPIEEVREPSDHTEHQKAGAGGNSCNAGRPADGNGTPSLFGPPNLHRLRGVAVWPRTRLAVAQCSKRALARSAPRKAFTVFGRAIGAHIGGPFGCGLRYAANSSFSVT